MTTENKLAAARAFFDQVPHCQSLNMCLESTTSSKAVVSMPYSRRLVGDPTTGVLHGGAVSALLDTCGGVAVICHPEVGSITATLTLTINYMRSALPNRSVVASAHCYHVSRFVAFVRVSATDGEIDSPVAVANGAFTVG